jgi:hypothetical protein
MKIIKYKGLYTLIENKKGVLRVLASSWDRAELERIKEATQP